jgi:hypothetical protein
MSCQGGWGGWGRGINSGHKTEYRDSIRLSGGFFDQQLDLPRTMSKAKKTNRKREKNKNKIGSISLHWPFRVIESPKVGDVSMPLLARTIFDPFPFVRPLLLTFPDPAVGMAMATRSRETYIDTVRCTATIA